MPEARITHAVRLKFVAGARAHVNLSGAAFFDPSLWALGDETSHAGGPLPLDAVGAEVLRFGEARTFSTSQG